MREHLQALAGGMKGYDRERLKDFLGRVLTDIMLDPGSDEFQLHYRIELRSRSVRSNGSPEGRSLRVASPRGFGTIPTIVARTSAKVA